MKIAIISDIHGNIDALKVVLKKLTKCELILCAGDLTGYYPDINPVIGMIKDNRVQSILGNHDLYLIQGKLPENIAFWVKKPFEYQLKNICPENLEFTKTLKKQKVIKIDGLKIGIFHGSPKSIEEYIYPDSNFEQFEKSDFDYIILGHTHIPMHLKIGKTIVINPGSVGQPRDNDRRSSYALWDTKTKKIQFERVSYNIEKVCQKIRKLKFDQKLAEILRKNEQKS